MEQFRHTIKTELKSLEKGSGDRQAKLEELQRIVSDRATTAPKLQNTFNLDDTPVYDIGKSQVTRYNPKSKKDTFYNFDGSRDKYLG